MGSPGQRAGNWASALRFCLHSHQATPYSEALIQRGQKEQDFPIWLGHHPRHIFFNLSDLVSLWFSFSGRMDNEMAACLVWILLKAEHDKRTWEEMIHLRGDPGN